MSTLERAIVIAAEAHADQVDKAGAPYVLHPLRVMLAVDGRNARIAAVLHDVVEDTGWTLDELRGEEFEEVVVEAVDALTRREGEPYMDFCRRAARNEIARRVKLADIADNLGPRRMADLPEADRSLAKRYRKARDVLLAAES